MLTQEEILAAMTWAQGQRNVSRGILARSESKAAQNGNIACMGAWKGGVHVFTYHAFSNSSCIGKLKLEFCPSVPKDMLGSVGFSKSAQLANHTEPKLFTQLLNREAGDYDKVILASELDCCGSCVRQSVNTMCAVFAMQELAQMPAIKFIVVEIYSGLVREGHDYPIKGLGSH